MQQPINQITTMRLPDGRQVAFVDWTDRPLYSTCDILTGATDERIPLFNYTNGDSVSASNNITAKRTASDRDTNIATPSAMASTEEMLIYAIRPEYNALGTDPETPTDATTATERLPLDPVPMMWQLAALFRLALLEIRVSQKTQHQAPLGYYNTGFGPMAQASVPGLTTVAIPATAGLPGQSAVRALSVPIHIGGQEKYEVAIVNPSGAALDIGLASNVLGEPPEVEEANRLFQVRVLLDGLYKRPVA